MTWNGVRGTLHWMLLIAMVGTIAIGGVAARWWAAKDQLLANVIREHLARSIPDCHATFEAVRLVDTAHIEMTHLLLRSRNDGSELVRVPRIVIKIENQILHTHRRLVVREITVQSPEIIAVRNEAQRWNWADIKIQPPKSSVSPSWIIKNGTVRIGSISPFDGSMRVVKLQGIQLGFEPESFQNYSFSGTGVADTVGPVSIAGKIDTQSGEWSLKGGANEIHLADPLLDLAGRFQPHLLGHLAEIRQTNAAILAQTRTTLPVQTVSGDGSSPSGVKVEINNSIMRADISLHFEMSQPSKNSPLNYQISGTIDHGHISEVLLPLPLYDLSGQFRITPEVILIKNFKAANGPSTLYIDGMAKRTLAGWSQDFEVRASQLKLDERVRSFLWGSMAKSYDMLSPSGTFDVDVKLAKNPGEALQYHISKFAAKDCRVLCDYFQLPVQNVNGKISQNGTGFEIEMRGEASGYPVTATGVIDLANPKRDIDLQLQIKNFPYDNNIPSALKREDQQTIRRILESLQLQGMAESVLVKIVRGGETEGKVKLCLEGDLSGGTLNYKGFPYSLTDLKGRLTYNPLERDTWIFNDVSGKHGDTQVKGRGFYDLEQSPGELILEMNVLQAKLDFDLQRACVTARPSLESVWSDFNLQGLIDIEQVVVSWSPGTECDVKLDGIHWTHGQFLANALPYQWQNVSGTLAWADRRLKIHSLHGDHNGTYLLIDGATPDSAFVDITPSDEVAWRLFLDERKLHIIKLNSDDELRRAVPPLLADALKTIDLKGPVDLSVGLEMKGWEGQEAMITASWSAMTALKNNEVYAGVILSNVNGNLVHRGSWDGQNLWMEGYAEIASFNALNLTFSKAKGPFLYKNQRLVVGMPRLSGEEPVYSKSNPYHREQFRADTYGGQIGLDADVRFASEAKNTTYQLDMTLKDAELGLWAKEQNIDSQRLMGKVTGVLQASGKGTSSKQTTGQGWIQITPAALYELPVFAQIFTTLSFRPSRPGDAAFSYAYGDFTIHDELFDFTNIELLGDALNLVGRGTIGYAGTKTSKLDLDFYSMANNRIPLLGPLIKAVGDRWIRVSVFGSIEQPLARIESRIPYLNDAFSGFMDAIENGSKRTPPQRDFPR
ncbi:hypothetical protein SH668x_000319 [Planctomicrobium sp. SH668]|uniref:hypothetical protein n=1 Tax=Planctomicrobium sp. SH668 TaxID=3448126 RepID=UPI003F5BFEF0